MPTSSDPAVRVLVPTGMLGAGFPAETVARGVAMGADVIAVDAGSTDSGPYYLGAAVSKTGAAQVARDLRLLLRAAAGADIPLIVGSSGTSGTDAGVDWMAAIVRQILSEEGLTRTVGRIYSEQDPHALAAALHRGQISALPGAPAVDATVLTGCEHIVGLMGHEPIVAALTAGADVVIGGRATDTAVLAAVPLMRGTPGGPTWHAAKVAECGGLCTTTPNAGGVLITVDATGFTIEPLDPNASCTPRSVAAHMLYENADPFVMREPTGWLDTSAATYTALDDRRVRVEGSLFHPAPTTVKLEGSAIRGYETVSLVGIRDPETLESIDLWLKVLADVIALRVRDILQLQETDYRVELRAYGHNAVLGELEAAPGQPREVGVLLLTQAADQATATAIAKVANPLLLHLPLPGMDHLPSFAFATSPAEIERGPAYEFVLNHALSVADGLAVFRIDMDGAPDA